MKKNIFVTLMLAAILVVSLVLTEIYVVCSNPKQDDSQFHIVTSFYPMYVACANLVDGVEHVALDNLSEPQTGCLHDFTLQPSDMKLIAKADVFVINGAGMESFIEDVLTEYPSLPIVDASEGIELLGEDAHEHEAEDAHEHEAEDGHEHEAEGDHEHEAEDVHEHEAEEAHDHHHDEANGHVWMSINLYRRQVKQIADALMKMDPVHATAYEKNYENYESKLAKLADAASSLKTQISGTPVVVLHEAYDYVAEDLGLEVAECVNLDEEDQVTAFSSGDRANLVNIICEEGIEVMLVEAKYGQSIAETIKEEVEKKSNLTLQLVYLDTANRGDYSGDSYIASMEANLSAIDNAIAHN